jgi:hypothetical protein
MAFALAKAEAALVEAEVVGTEEVAADSMG